MLVRVDPQHMDAVWTAFRAVKISPTILLYVGPDQIMPLTSVLSAIVGVVLMFWNRIVGWVGRGWAAMTRRGQPSQAEGTKTQHDGVA